MVLFAQQQEIARRGCLVGDWYEWPHSHSISVFRPLVDEYINTVLFSELRSSSTAVDQWNSTSITNCEMLLLPLVHLWKKKMHKSKCFQYVLLDKRTSTRASWKVTQNAPSPGSSTLSRISVGSILSAGDLYARMLLMWFISSYFIQAPKQWFKNKRFVNVSKLHLKASIAISRCPWVDAIYGAIICHELESRVCGRWRRPSRTFWIITCW